MVVPCIPCAVVAAPLGPPIATLFGVGATAVVARRSLKGCKRKKKKRKNKNKVKRKYKTKRKRIKIKSKTKYDKKRYKNTIVKNKK